jgi:NADH:ubiquinone oxidoreductase subunit 5 (subunit L)/multisubunit Na+/H+ antiporter MnhA subunit
VALVAVASIALGGMAAILHDDIEHVLGYAVVQDAGVALLAFAAVDPATAAPARDWLIATATVKSGLAAWIIVAKAEYGVHRIPDLRGWARHDPVLGAAFVLVLIGAVGLPGMALFEARGALVEAAIPGPLGVPVLLVAFLPILYLGRILLVGLGPIGPAAAAAAAAREELLDREAEAAAGPGTRRWLRSRWSATRGAASVAALAVLVRVHRFRVAAMTAVLIAAIGLALAVGGLGNAVVEPPVGGEPGGAGASPVASGGPVDSPAAGPSSSPTGSGGTD